MYTEKITPYAPFRHLLTGLVLITLTACSPPGPSTDKMRLDLQDMVSEKSKGLLMVSGIQINDTENPAEDRLYYNVNAIITVPDNQQSIVDQIAKTPYNQPFPGQLPIYGQFRHTWVDVFFNGLGWNGPAVQAFLEDDQTASIPVRLYYKMETKDIWTLQSVPKIQNIKTTLF